jgi:Xaa-Pro aminopeptidase
LDVAWLGAGANAGNEELHVPTRRADEALKPGFVFACDIQLFRLKEKIGIRIEDTIAITEYGYENLSQGLPRTVEEIEALKKAKGLLQILEGEGP